MSSAVETPPRPKPAYLSSFFRRFVFATFLIFSAVAPLSAQSASSPATAAAEGAATETQTLTLPGVSLAERFNQGGSIMYFLLALSFVTVTFTVERLVQLRRKTVNPPGLADKAREAWKSGDMQKVIQTAEAQPSVLASTIALLARHPHLSVNEASVMAGDDVSRAMRRHLQRAYPLAIVATLSPLLGLLGTIIGMIEAFEVVAIAGSLGDASLLAGAISLALITTAFGLIVAIPSLGLYHHFRGKTHELSLEVEEELEELLSEWFRAPSPGGPEARG